ncbi:hypothetical protein ACFXKG_30750 [Streptomyces sp. NPDC059255]|uniref:hypothetical protein n=1 Tax=Streptomyces sp. NPDC059255 TaxID=3346793 RepID=UPI0036802149
MFTKKPQPGPVFTLQPAPEPTWWQLHRHQVLSATALISGFYLGTQATDTPADAQPAPVAPAARTTP